jgi:SAM-dependent methyltransferase
VVARCSLLTAGLNLASVSQISMTHSQWSSEPALGQWRARLERRLAAARAGDLSDPAPLPPVSLIASVNAPDKTDPRVFVESGLGDLLALVDALDAAGGVLPERPAVLELGCGVGRLLRHVPPELADVTATDINENALAWCRANLQHVECHHHGPEPPIAALGGERFDLVYANSVFTHIPLDRQHDWVSEVHRLLRPGGWIVATVLGATHQELLLDAAGRSELAERGALQITPVPSAEGGEPVAWGAVFQSAPRLEALFGALFERFTLRERPGWQDVIVARRASTSSRS